MRFTLEKDHWYAMELIGPEFGETVRAYSPIRIKQVVTHGGGARRLQMDFFHANYPAGVQNKSYLVGTIDRQRDYFLGRVSQSDRFILLVNLNHAWLSHHFDAQIGPDGSLEEWCELHSRHTG